MLDDLGATDLGCTGSPFYETPHLNRLAKDGMRFTQAYSACTVCSPTRASLMSGKYPARVGVTDFHSEISGARSTVERLQGQGRDALRPCRAHVPAAPAR